MAGLDVTAVSASSKLDQTATALDSPPLQAALAALESRYRDLQDQSEQRIQVLQESLDQQRAAHDQLQHELEEARRITAARRRKEEELSEEVRRLQRELEVLRVECERRYPALRLSEDRGRALEELQRQLDRCHEEREKLARQLRQARRVPVHAEPPSSAAVLQLEQQLREAREEAELRRLQLQQVQLELEHYFLLAEGRPSSAPASPTAEVLPAEPASSSMAPLPHRDADAINHNRLRLMASL